MTRALRAVLVVLGVSIVGAALVSLLLWLDVSRGLDDRVAAGWQHVYERLALRVVAYTGVPVHNGLLLGFLASDLLCVVVLFAAAYAWGRSGLAASPYAWLPIWLAPLWVASGMSGSLFKARAMAALALAAGPADGLQYERAWRLVQPEAFVFLAAGLVAGILGWWAGRRAAVRATRVRHEDDTGV